MKDFLDLLEGDELEPSVAEMSEHRAHVAQKIDKFITFMNFKPSKRRYILESAMERMRFFQEEGAETVSDFPALFGTVIDRQLKADYKIQTPAYKNYVKIGTQRDFRAQNIIGVFGLQSNLSSITELGPYSTGKLADGKVSNVVKKYGRVFPLSWEAIINDDLGAFSDAAQRLANAARRTEYMQATKLISSATGPNTALFGTSLTHPIDGATIDNQGTSDLTSDTLFATINLMQNQVDVDGEPVIVDGFELVVPPNKQKAALEAVNPAALIAVGIGNSAARQTSANVTAMLNVRINVNPYLPIVDVSGGGNKTWYIIASLSNGAAVQMNFLAGHEDPELCMKASDKVSLGGGLVSAMEGNFQNDAAFWRVRHILGGTQIDPRLAYAQVSGS